MKIFYGKSTGSSDVPCESPIDVSLDTALSVFSNLKPGSGFLSVELDARFVVQFLTRKSGAVEVELLDRSIPAFDSCSADAAFAESLIHAAVAEQDVFQLARSSDYKWKHTDLSFTRRSPTAPPGG